MTFRGSAVATLVGGLCVALLAGCASSTPNAGPSPSPSGIGASVSSAISKAASAATSAFAQITGGIDAVSDVEAGSVALGSDGHASTELTIENRTDDEHDYTVSVAFLAADGGLRDVVVVNARKVPAHGRSHATARSNRELSGTSTAKVQAAVRH